MIRDSHFYNHPMVESPTLVSDANSTPRLRRFLATWAILGVLFLALQAAWSFASPPGFRSDEPSHITKAAGLVRGQLIGTTGTNLIGRPANRTFEVPQTYASESLQCTKKLSANAPAGCMGSLKNLPRTVSSESYTGRYPPLYYALVGVPSLFGTSQWLVIAMRLVSSALNAVMFALAGAVALCWLRSRLVGVGTLLVASPMILYLTSAVNPNGLEITAALAGWVCGLALMERAEERPSHLLLALFTASLAVSASMRALSVLWVLMILGTLVLYRPAAWRSLWRSRSVRVGAVILGAVMVIDLVYVVVAKAYLLRRADPSRVVAPGSPFFEHLKVALKGFTGYRGYGSQLIGIHYGFASPIFFRVLIGLALGVMILGGLFFAAQRGRLIIIGILLASAFASIVIPLKNQLGVGDPGNTWNARYVMPYLVGALVISAYEVARRSQLDRSWVPFAIAGAMSIGTLMGLYTTLVRQMIGLGHGWNVFATVADGWHPPIPVAAVLALGLAGTAGLVVVLSVRRLPLVGAIPKGVPEQSTPGGN